MALPKIFSTIFKKEPPAQSNYLSLLLTPETVLACIWAFSQTDSINVLGFSKKSYGNVENLVGYSLITGAELATKFREEIERFNSQGLTIKEGEEVTNLSGQDGDFEVQTNAGKYRKRD